MLGDLTDNLIRNAATEENLDDLYQLYEEGRFGEARVLIDAQYFERFVRFAENCLSKIEKVFPELVDEIIQDIVNCNSVKMHTIREGGWIVASSGPFLVDVRVVRGGNKYCSASPCLSATRNLDRNALRYRRFVSDDLLSQQSLVNVDSFEFEGIPREIVCSNGLESLVICEEGEAIVLCLTCMPFGPYDLIFDAETLQLVGKFQADPRDSAISVALRIFAAGRWAGGREFAEKYAGSEVRETRWAALNYFWRAGQPEAKAHIAKFFSDPDSNIAALAHQAMARLN